MLFDSSALDGEDLLAIGWHGSGFGGVDGDRHKMEFSGCWEHTSDPHKKVHESMLKSACGTLLVAIYTAIEGGLSSMHAQITCAFIMEELAHYKHGTYHVF